MSFSRITVPSVTTNNIALLDNRPNISSAELKERFDQAGDDIVSALGTIAGQINNILTELERTNTENPGALNLGASAVWMGDNSAPNIQAKLSALKAYMDSLTIAAGSGDMLKSIYDTNNDGKVDTAENAEKLGDILASGYSREISGQIQKDAIVDDDAFPLADSAAANAQKKTLWSTIKTTLAAVFAKEITGQSELTSISDSDAIPVYDAAAAVQKKALWSTVKNIFAPKIAIVADMASTEVTIATAANNTEYRFATLTSLTVSAVPAGYFSCRILCTAGTDMEIVLPAGTLNAGGIDFACEAGDKLQIYLDQDGATVVPFRAAS